MTSHIDPELEAAYDTARTTPAGSGPYVARFAEASAAARLACPHRTVRYGDRPAEAIDLFRRRPARRCSSSFTAATGGA